MNIFRRLFSSFIDTDNGQVETLPEESALPEVASLSDEVEGQPRIQVAHAVSIGRMRDHNEDSLLTLTSTFAGHEAVPGFGLFVVADGMGGHSLGERASAIATRVITREVVGRLYLSLLAESSDGNEMPPLQEVMLAALSASNQEVAAQIPEGGTTATVGLAIGSRLLVAHVGDSRAYLVTESGLQQLTRDHSLVQRLQELGQLSAEEAAIHPQRNVLYRAIGQGEGLEIDVQTHQIPPNARLLICSDGLWGLVEDHELFAIIQNAETMQEACDNMVLAANEAGGPDNITVLMVAFAS